MSRKRLPIGIQDFEKIINDGYLYVDKTEYIYSLTHGDGSAYFLSRPRRFGKSTFVQMLKCFYDISYKDRYDALFAGTEIYKANLKSHSTYHVLNFDFSRVNTHNKKAIYKSFFSAVAFGINNFKKRYPDFIFDYESLDKSDSVTLFNNFASAYTNYSSEGRLYVMIDEYDNFANQILVQNLKLFRYITSSGGFLKDFYASIKAATVDAACIAKTFITGVSSASLDSLTSGFNITLNVTSDKRFNSYAGFTEMELKLLIPQLVDVASIGVSVDDVISRMKPVYDGYCFSRLAENTLYNSSMCLYYLNQMQSYQEFLAPEKTVDPASDSDGSKLKQLFDLSEKGLPNKIINNYLSGEAFILDKLAENINLNKNSKYDETQLLSMLYYLGYLTIDPQLSSMDRIVLKIPNLFTSVLFAQCTVDLRLKPNNIFCDHTLDVSSLLDTSDDLSTFANSCTEFLSAIFSNQVLSHMSEMALNLVLHAKLSQILGKAAELQKPLHVVAKGEKYADLVVTVNIGKSNECIYVIELKYSSKKDATEGNITKLKNEAAEQTKTYSSAIEFKGKMVKAYSMIFVGPECVFWG